MHLKTIDALDLTSRDGISAKVAELKKRVDEITKKQVTLKSEIAQIRYYIDNLIREQKCKLDEEITRKKS